MESVQYTIVKSRKPSNKITPWQGGISFSLNPAELSFLSKLFTKDVKGHEHFQNLSYNQHLRNQKTVASDLYFTKDLKCNIVEKKPNMCFKSEGWLEDNKEWGLLWTKPVMPSWCVKQKMVKVVTDEGEAVTAITFDMSSCELKWN